MTIRNDEERESLRRCGQALAIITDALLQRIKPGMTGRLLAQEAERMMLACGGKPVFKGYGHPPFPDVICISVNACVVHGIPNDVPFEAGDVVSLDIGMSLNGMITDMARTVALTPVSPATRKLVEGTRSALEVAIQTVHAGSTVGDLGAKIQKHLERKGLGVVRDLAGHGVGRALHEAPEVPNFGKPGTGPVLKEGAVIAIEPMVTLGDWHVRISSDRWAVVTADGSLAAHEEDTVIVTVTGCEVITRLNV